MKGQRHNINNTYISAMAGLITSLYRFAFVFGKLLFGKVLPKFGELEESGQDRTSRSTRLCTGLAMFSSNAFPDALKPCSRWF